MAQRYLIELAYDGTHYAGWQIQNNAKTIQAVIEETLSKIYGQAISIVGCGRTDTGVHASQYYMHLDLDPEKYDDDFLLYKLNGLTPLDIGFKKVHRVSEEAHARYDAVSRSYEYYMHFHKDPFLVGRSYKYNQSLIPDIELMKEAAKVILDYSDFFTFCKAQTQVDHHKCTIMRSEWEELGDGRLVYHVTANRFLRGMVRMLVGMCINVAIEKYPLQDVIEALDKQKRLEYAWSVPAEGLYLSKIEYPYIEI
jgi:tRNA pseudouridine38-40 synthase